MDDYVRSLAALLTPYRNPEAAVPMKKYLRDQFECLGLKNGERSKLVKQFFAEHGLPPREQLSSVLIALWELPERDYQYTGLDLLTAYKQTLGEADIDLVEWLITHKSWWDTVDLLAAHSAGTIFQKSPQLIPIYGEKWISSENLWLRRSALLFQLRYKGKTDEALLYDYIERCAGSDQFFLQKAIGWALREYSKTNPESVEQFLARADVKPLSRREGGKYLKRLNDTCEVKI